MAVANTIALAQAYLPVLDSVYAAEAKTSILDTANSNIQWIGAKTAQVYKMRLDGMGTYNRNTGFVDGNETGTWEALTLSQDRGRSFMIDNMDNEETMGMTFGSLAGEFISKKVAPEIDAYVFAKLAGTTGIDGTTGTISSSSDVSDLIAAAEESMGNNEVTTEGRILFVSETTYRYLKAKITREVVNTETNINHTIEVFDGMQVIRVPQTRFYSAITLYDGTTSGQTVGGYIKATSAVDLNFVIVAPDAVRKITKHEVPRIFAPEVNQSADAWKFQYRIYHDVFVLDNKAKGIYVHKKAS